MTFTIPILRIRIVPRGYVLETNLGDHYRAKAEVLWLMLLLPVKVKISAQTEEPRMEPLPYYSFPKGLRHDLRILSRALAALPTRKLLNAQHASMVAAPKFGTEAYAKRIKDVKVIVNWGEGIAWYTTGEKPLQWENI